MRKSWFFVIASSLAAGLWAPGAEVARRDVDVEILPDGSYRTRTHLELRLASAADIGTWSPIAIPLDDTCVLEALGGTVTSADGSSRRLRRAELDTVGEASASVVASSSSWRVISLAEIPPGSLLALDYATLTHPYYPVGQVAELRSRLAPTARLTVTVRSTDSRFRYRLWGDSAGLTVTPSEHGVSVTGSELPPIKLLADGPDLRSAGPALRFAWGGAGTWEDVGRWWLALIASLRPPGERVAAAAGTLGLAGRPPADAVDTVLGFLHSNVRYVGVELGIGGWKPADTETTLARGWGDCKALTILAIALLRHAGVHAVPAAVAIGDGALVDSDFPTLGAFDHVVVAVPTAEVGDAGILDQSGTYLLLDPTQTQPRLDRTPSHLMGRRLLLLRDAAPALVTAAEVPAREAHRLRVELVVEPDGSGRGTACLEMVGETAAAWLSVAKTVQPHDLDLRGRQALSALLPAANLLDFSWKDQARNEPAVALLASLTVAGVVVGGASSTWLQAGGPVMTPVPSTLATRLLPYIGPPQELEVSWALRLPAGWRLVPFDPVTISNDVGAFTEVLQLSGAEAQLTRRCELRRRLVEVAALPQLREIAAAEHRAQRRRLLVERPSANAVGVVSR